MHFSSDDLGAESHKNVVRNIQVTFWVFLPAVNHSGLGSSGLKTSPI